MAATVPLDGAFIKGRKVMPGYKNAEKAAIRGVAGETIAVGKVCYLTGTTGAKPNVSLATNATAAKTQGTLFIAASGGASGDDILLLPIGTISTVDTSAASAVGQVVYLGTSGDWTLTKPTTAIVRVIGSVLEDHASTGQVAFNGFEQSQPRIHSSDAVAIVKAVAGAASVALTTGNLGGNYDNSPVVATCLTNDAGKYVLHAVWDGSGGLTVTFSASYTGDVSVVVFPRGDDLG